MAVTDNADPGMTVAGDHPVLDHRVRLIALDRGMFVLDARQTPDDVVRPIECVIPPTQPVEHRRGNQHITVQHERIIVNALKPASKRFGVVILVPAVENDCVIEVHMVFDALVSVAEHDRHTIYAAIE